jgi:hypothetical protein
MRKIFFAESAMEGLDNCGEKQKRLIWRNNSPCLLRQGKKESAEYKVLSSE